jgi:putative phosphoesterase
MPTDQLLPPGLAAGKVQARIGLISDTHMPQRCRQIPPAVFDLFWQADLILHAGDIGELWVLDQLGALAPVVAVHGNDDSEDAQRELPYQQVVCVAGVRILLWHSHYPDWDEEMASRKADAISPARLLARARRASAPLVVFGHWHIPLCYEQDGIMVINPGALASGNEFTRQVCQTVALLLIDHQAHPHVVHIDLAAPDRPFPATVDWKAGFAANLDRYNAPIVTPELSLALAYLRPRLRREEIFDLRDTFVELAYPAWDGNKPEMTLEEVERALDSADIAPSLKKRVSTLLAEWRNDARQQ